MNVDFSNRKSNWTSISAGKVQLDHKNSNPKPSGSTGRSAENAYSQPFHTSGW